MKRTKYYAFIAAAFCAGAVSCARESGVGVPEAGEPVETGYYLPTRADNSGNPLHGDTYTILSYMKGGETSTHADTHYLRNSNQFGYYAYDGTVGANGELVPVAVDDKYKPVGGTNPLSRDQSQAQRLQGVPATATNPTYQGFYRVAMIHPAIPVHNSELGFMAVFNRTDKIYASHPDDKDGDGVPDDPFEIEVETNQEMHPVEGVVMRPIKAAIRIYLYSHDEAGTSQEFAEVEVKLINAGSNGWFNARTDIVYPNYNYSDADYRTRYSSKVDENVGGQNAEVLTAMADNTQIPGKNEVYAQYMVNDVSVFPTDYRGGEGGGSPFIIPMTLSLTIKNQGAERSNTAAVPIALEIKRNQRYTFYINVKSELIEVQYSRSEWTPQGGIYDPVGGDTETYPLVTINRDDGGWGNVSGEDMPIGD